MDDAARNTRRVALMSKEKVENLRVRSKLYDTDMVIVEGYCSDPKCDCRDVHLKFHKVDENNNEGKILFSVRLSLDTFEVLDKAVYEKGIKADEIVRELLEDLGDMVRIRFNTHYKIAKGMDEEKQSENISPKIRELIMMGNCISYNEVYEVSESIFFRDGENNLIYFDDQYCMNPKCLCNEVYLSIIEIDETNTNNRHIFTLRYNLKNGNYEVEFKACTEERMKDVIKSFKQEEKEIQRKLKQRYKTMKSVGEKVYRENKAANVPESTAVKIGRNDPCPCGSGKKYKKCCEK